MVADSCRTHPYVDFAAERISLTRSLASLYSQRKHPCCRGLRCIVPCRRNGKCICTGCRASGGRRIRNGDGRTSHSRTVIAISRIGGAECIRPQRQRVCGNCDGSLSVRKRGRRGAIRTAGQHDSAAWFYRSRSSHRHANRKRHIERNRIAARFHSDRRRDF